MTDPAKLYHVKNARKLAAAFYEAGRRIEALAGIRCSKCLLQAISDNVDNCEVDDCPLKGREA